MRILIITQRWYPDTFGGSEHVAAQQAARLAARGHQVTVITERVREDLPRDIDDRGVRILRYGNPKEFSRLAGASRTDLKEVPKVLREITRLRDYEIKNIRNLTNSQTRKFDTAILHHPFPAYGFFKTRLKIPTLYVFHSSTAREIEFEGVKKFPISNLPRTSRLCGMVRGFQFPMVARLLGKGFAWWTLKIERAALMQADKVAIFSEFSKGVLLGIAPETQNKILRLAVGIDQQLFCTGDKIGARKKLGLNATRPLLLTVRRFTLRMGLSKLIHAMELVFEKLPELQLLIIGEGHLRVALQKEIELRRLQGKVTLVGAVPIADLPTYYQAADLFVLPTEAFEGLGMSTLEALSSGLPIVGTPAGATPEVLAWLDKSLLTSGSGAVSIAEGIEYFFARPEAERTQLRQRARKVAQERYSWKKAIDELEGVLEKLKHDNTITR